MVRGEGPTSLARQLPHGNLSAPTLPSHPALPCFQVICPWCFCAGGFLVGSALSSTGGRLELWTVPACMEFLQGFPASEASCSLAPEALSPRIQNLLDLVYSLSPHMQNLRPHFLSQTASLLTGSALQCPSLKAPSFSLSFLGALSCKGTQLCHRAVSTMMLSSYQPNNFLYWISCQIAGVVLPAGSSLTDLLKETWTHGWELPSSKVAIKSSHIIKQWKQRNIILKVVINTTTTNNNSINIWLSPYLECKKWNLGSTYSFQDAILAS